MKKMVFTFKAYAIGFYVSDASLDLAIVGEQAGRKWIGVAGHVTSMGVVGLPSSFTLKVKDLDFVYNLAVCDGKRMDWAALSINGADGFGYYVHVGLGVDAAGDGQAGEFEFGIIVVAGLRVSAGRGDAALH